jgi:hypothetical protein
VYPFGDAKSYGAPAFPLNKPIVGIASTPDGKGYWLVASDGGVFAFNAPFSYSLGGSGLTSPFVGMAPDVSSPLSTYWLVDSGGGISAPAFLNLPWYGDMFGQALNAPIVGMAQS